MGGQPPPAARFAQRNFFHPMTRSVLRLLTGGCRLLLGSNARKAALVKAFHLPATPANEWSVFPHPRTEQII